MYVVFFRDGTHVTIQADSFTKTSHEVLFYDGEPVRRRSQDPDYESAVAVFYHDALAGFAEKPRIQTSEG